MSNPCLNRLSEGQVPRDAAFTQMKTVDIVARRGVFCGSVDANAGQFVNVDTTNININETLSIPIVDNVLQTPPQAEGSLVFDPQNQKLYYSDGTQWLQVFSFNPATGKCISDEDFDTEICVDGNMIVFITDSKVRVALNGDGSMTETVLSKQVDVINNHNVTSTNGDITNATDTGDITNISNNGGDITNTTTNDGDITNTTDTGNIGNQSNNGGNITNTTTNAGDISNTTDTGDITNTSNNGGNITSTTTNNGDITNTTDTGDIINQSNNGGNITHTTTNDGDITNTTDTGDIINQSNNGGNITNTTTNDGDITNTTDTGDISNVSNNGGNITHTTTNDGDITNTTDTGDIINQSNNGGDITNTTTNDGDITNTTDTGDINNTSNNGGNINNTTTNDGDITNTTDTGNINNTSNNGGDITNTTTNDGDITNITDSGDINNVSNNGGDITNTTTNDGDITNTTTDGGIKNTTNSGDICNETTTGSIIESAASKQITVQNNFEITSTQGDIIQTAEEGDWCTFTLDGFIKSSALSYLLDTAEKIVMKAVGADPSDCILLQICQGNIIEEALDGNISSLAPQGTIIQDGQAITVDAVNDILTNSANGEICSRAPSSRIKHESNTAEYLTEGDTLIEAGTMLVARAMPGADIIARAMPGGDIIGRSMNGDIQLISTNNNILQDANQMIMTNSGTSTSIINNGSDGINVTDNGDNTNGGRITHTARGGPNSGGRNENIAEGSPSGTDGGQNNSTSEGGNGPNSSGGEHNSTSNGGSGPNSSGGRHNIRSEGSDSSGSNSGGRTTITSTAGAGGGPGSGGKVGITADGEDSEVMVEVTGDNNCGVTICVAGNNSKGVMIEAPMTTIDGNLCVTGDSITANTETLNVNDNCIYMNNNYTVTVGMGGCIVINYLPTSNVASVDIGGFSAGVMGISNPMVFKTNTHTFGPGDLIQISGASVLSNNGLFEVLSDTGVLLTIRGIGTVAATVDFVQNQFAADGTVAGEIRQVNVRTLGSSATGEFITSNGNNTGDTSINNPDPVVLSIVPGTGILVDDTDPSNPIVSTDGSQVQSVNAGPGISITGPAQNPIVNNEGVITVAVNGPGLTIDNSDPQNLEITNDGVLSVTAGQGITVDNSDVQNPVVLNNPLSKTRCTYHFYNPTHFDVDFKVGASNDPVLWAVPATLYEANNIVVDSDGRLEMSGATVSPTIVKIDWYVEGDFVTAANDNAVISLMYIYKNGTSIPQSVRRFVDPYIFAKYVEVNVSSLPGLPSSIFYNNLPEAQARQYTEGQTSGSCITELENGDIIDLRGGLVDPGSSGSVTDRELFNYSITITEL